MVPPVDKQVSLRTRPMVPSAPSARSSEPTTPLQCGLGQQDPARSGQTWLGGRQDQCGRISCSMRQNSPHQQWSSCPDPGSSRRVTGATPHGASKRLPSIRRRAEAVDERAALPCGRAPPPPLRPGRQGQCGRIGCSIRPYLPRECAGLPRFAPDSCAEQSRQRPRSRRRLQDSRCDFAGWPRAGQRRSTAWRRARPREDQRGLARSQCR